MPEASQNEVKIEEYESENHSRAGSRTNSIKFVMLKQDIMFENPQTPELRKVLKNRVHPNDLEKNREIQSCQVVAQGWLR